MNLTHIVFKSSTFWTATPFKYDFISGIPEPWASGARNTVRNEDMLIRQTEVETK